MAKKHETVATVAADASPAKAGLTTEAFGFTFDAATASPEALAYVIGFGFRQALSDATAGLPKAITTAWDYRNTEGDAAKPYEAYCATAGLDPDAARSMALGAFIAAVCDGARRSRYDRIMSGTMGMRAGSGKPRADTAERMALAIAKEWLVAAASAKGKALPKGEELAKIISDYRAKYADKIAAEVARRAAQSAPADFDF